MTCDTRAGRFRKILQKTSTVVYVLIFSMRMWNMTVGSRRAAAAAAHLHICTAVLVQGKVLMI